MKSWIIKLRLILCGFKKKCNNRSLFIDTDRYSVSIYEDNYEYACLLFNKHNKLVYSCYVSSSSYKRNAMSFAEITDILIREYKNHYKRSRKYNVWLYKEKNYIKTY